MMEAVLDNVEGMLDYRAHLRERPLDRFGQLPQRLRQRLDDAALDRDVPRYVAVGQFGPLVRPGVAGIAEDGDYPEFRARRAVEPIRPWQR